MTTYTVTQLKQDVEAMLHGASLSDVINPTDIVNRAARDVLADVDPMETKRVYEFSGGLFDNSTRVYNYLLPNDLKLNKVIDLRPQVNRFNGDNPIQHTSKEFDLYKAVSSITVDNDTGLKFLRASIASSAAAILNNYTNVSGSNGTNSASGVATTLTQDTLYKVNGGASLSFTLTGAGTGTITNSTLSTTDLTKYLNIASAFVWVYIPATPTSVTSVTLTWGSSSSNYWTASATTNFWSQAFVIGWNLIKVSWPTSSVGSPDVTKVVYNKVDIAWAGGNQTTFRINDFFFALPAIYELVYYSKFIFQTSAGVWQENTTSDTDLVNLDTDSYNLLTYKTTELAALQIQHAIPLRGKLINFDYDTYGTIYSAALKRYKENYKSEALRVVGSYYRNRYIRQR